MRDGVGLFAADLDQQFPLRSQMLRDIGNQTADHVQAVGAAVESRARLVQTDIGGERFDLGRRDVRRVADNQIELLVSHERCEEVAAQPTDAITDLMLVSVRSRDVERGR